MQQDSYSGSAVLPISKVRGFMNYTIFTLPQVLERTITVPGAGDSYVTRPNIPDRVYPAGITFIYEPPELDIYNPDPLQRRVLLADPNGSAAMSEIVAAFPALLDAKYNALWQAAHAWEQKFISGVGLSILSLGVAKGKPKALAVANWSQDLWTLYYQRKVAISIEAQPELDFTAAGDMPYSVPELSQEISA